ncbi:tail fiber assembly protein [Morganella sp. GD04133]|uniref:tail fiber assembly protein n=1 Tax=Morganella sp. GD04133 TaxID=2975435 RepID=UPI00244B3D12|nr:tail fiber assembly protein [Morganella sp. GD04133]MDH0356721.1 tail fiber assembly protein [Morganella sp. GD04133]
MKYYKNKENAVYAYDDACLSQVAALTVLESLISEKEPELTDADSRFRYAEHELNEAKKRLNQLFESPEDSENANTEETATLMRDVEEKTIIYDEAAREFNRVKTDYQQLEAEYDAVFPVFFEIRENLKSMTEMSAKETQAYLNPPVAQSRLINDAEHKKQALLAEASEKTELWRTQLMLGIITDEDKARLTEWMLYVQKLQALDASIAPDKKTHLKPV